MEKSLPIVNISEIKKRRNQSIQSMRVHLDKLEALEQQEDIYRQKKRLLNLKQNQKRKQTKQDKYF